MRGDSGLVQLANVVHTTEAVGPKELNHFNRQRSATITANLIPFVSLGKALDDLDQITNTSLPQDIKRDYGGQSREYKESSRGLYFFFLLALVFIYLVLAAQFESFIHPFTILLSVPLAVVGALIALFVFRQSLNIFSQIGLIMLIGLVTKNAILIVEFANQLRSRGRDVVEAVVEASSIRLRPILMTSFATVFGILPIAIGFGAGAESRRPLGIAVVGGMLFSTFLTLMLVPVVYTLMARFTRVEAEDTRSPGEHPRVGASAARRISRQLITLLALDRKPLAGLSPFQNSTANDPARTPSLITILDNPPQSPLAISSPSRACWGYPVAARYLSHVITCRDGRVVSGGDLPPSCAEAA